MSGPVERRRAEDELLDLIEAFPEPPDRGPELLAVVLRHFVGVQDRLGSLPEFGHRREEVTQGAGFVDPKADLHDPRQGFDGLLVVGAFRLDLQPVPLEGEVGEVGEAEDRLPVHNSADLLFPVEAGQRATPSRRELFHVAEPDLGVEAPGGPTEAGEWAAMEAAPSRAPSRHPAVRATATPPLGVRGSAGPDPGPIGCRRPSRGYQPYPGSGRGGSSNPKSSLLSSWIRPFASGRHRRASNSRNSSSSRGRLIAPSSRRSFNSQ